MKQTKLLGRQGAIAIGMPFIILGIILVLLFVLRSFAQSGFIKFLIGGLILLAFGVVFGILTGLIPILERIIQIIIAVFLFFQYFRLGGFEQPNDLFNTLLNRSVLGINLLALIKSPQT